MPWNLRSKLCCFTGRQIILAKGLFGQGRSFFHYLKCKRGPHKKGKQWQAAKQYLDMQIWNWEGQNPARAKGSKEHKRSILQVSLQRSSEKMWALGDDWGRSDAEKTKYSIFFFLPPSCLSLHRKTNPVMFCEEEGEPLLRATCDSTKGGWER